MLALAACSSVAFAFPTLGPVPADPQYPNPSGHQFPAYYRDRTGLQLQPCLDLPTVTLDRCALLAAPTLAGSTISDGNPALNLASGVFPDTLTYYSAFADLPVGGGKSLTYRVALEGTFLPAVGGGLDKTQPIATLSIFIDADGLAPNQPYTVTHPYGVTRVTTNDVGKLVPRVAVIDVAPLESGPFDDFFGPSFEATLPPRTPPERFQFATYLAATALCGGAVAEGTGCRPAGFLGDGAPGPVTGSVFGTNFVRIEGPGIAGTCGAIQSCTETPNIAIHGKLLRVGATVGTFQLFGVADGTAGIPQDGVRVVALDAGGDVTPTSAAVTFSASYDPPGDGATSLLPDTTSILPAAADLAQGFDTVSLEPRKAGSFILSATQGAATGAHAPVTIGHAAPAKLEAVSGSGQTGLVGQVLGAPFVVRALDQFDNLTLSATQAVAFTATSGGSVAPVQVPIGADALAAATATLGAAAGTYVFKASLGAVEVSFQATATEPPPPPPPPSGGGGGGGGCATGGASGAAIPALAFALRAVLRRRKRLSR